MVAHYIVESRHHPQIISAPSITTVNADDTGVSAASFITIQHLLKAQFLQLAFQTRSSIYSFLG